MTHITCRLTAKNRNHLQNPTVGNQAWATFTLMQPCAGAWVGGAVVYVCVAAYGAPRPGQHRSAVGRNATQDLRGGEPVVAGGR